jgi:hypothetical protein
MELQYPKEMSAVDRERLLWAASGKYMRGEITVEQFEEIERLYNPGLREAVLTLAKRSKNKGKIRGR